MTATIPEQALEILTDLEGDWEIICDVASKRGEPGWSDCPGDPAVWVGWRVNCCPESPDYLLMCDYCKKYYERMEALGACIACGWCGQKDAGVHTYTRLEKRS